MNSYAKIRQRYFTADKLFDMAHMLLINPASPTQKLFRAYEAVSNLEEAPERDLVEEEEGKDNALSLLREAKSLLQNVISSMYDDEPLQMKRMEELQRINVSTLSFELSKDANTIQMGNLLHDVANDIVPQKGLRWLYPVSIGKWTLRINLAEMTLILWLVSLIVAIVIFGVGALPGWAIGTLISFVLIMLGNRK